MASKWTQSRRFDRDGIAVVFEPEAHVPGFGHRVVIVVGGQFVARDWLGDTFRPSAKTAEYFATKHAANIAHRLSMTAAYQQPALPPAPFAGHRR